MRSSLKVCVDANIVVKLLIPSIYPDMKDQWITWAKQGITFIAPPLLRYEAVSAFYQMNRQGSIESVTAAAAIKNLTLLPIELVIEDDLHRRAYEIAERFRIRAAYDAHYVALAQHLNAELWTADKRLYNAVQHHLDVVRLVP